ncbi:glycosyltransferase [Roseomonas sp. BN140053]|uniref:glycosyltransferase n=1 Tax=Roseomonas sp. BN140053 TaxID=3391898 RepID=UPI0039E7625F
MIPSVSGGVGHISRTGVLARALRRLDPGVSVEYVLDAGRLRPFNIAAVMQMGYRPRLLPARTRDNRDAVAQACLDDADVIVDDSMRYLVPLRACLPRAAWVSVPMYPVGDELFDDWPCLEQTDAVIWAYAPLVERPAELDLVADKLAVTGPFLDMGEVPEREAARAALGITAPFVAYAPRGFPFGLIFGHRALHAAIEGVAALRRGAHPELQLHLMAVKNPGELRGIAGVPDTLPDWVVVHGLAPQAEALARMRAADILLAEGSSTMHEGASLGTPMVLIPGPIAETLNLARALARHRGAHSVEPDDTTPEALARAFAAVLDDRTEAAAMAARARAAVTVGGGAEAAAQLVLRVAAEHRARRAARGEAV